MVLYGHQQPKTLFSELWGFAVYDPVTLQRYVEQSEVTSQNLLMRFVETPEGDKVTQNGIIFPILGLEADDYRIDVVIESSTTRERRTTAHSHLLEVISQQVRVVGIGYLVDWASITRENSLTVSLPNGWYDVTVVTHQDSQDQRGILLTFEKAAVKPTIDAGQLTDTVDRGERHR